MCNLHDLFRNSCFGWLVYKQSHKTVCGLSTYQPETSYQLPTVYVGCIYRTAESASGEGWTMC